MTQKEHNEKIEKYKQQIEELNLQLQEENRKNYNYEQVLEKYFTVNEELKREQESNKLNCKVIREQEEIIEKYKAIVDKFTFNSN